MKFIKRFNEMVNDTDSDLSKDSVYSKHKTPSDNDMIIYKPEWEKELPEFFSINYHDKIYKFRKGNIMLLDDLVEISYDSVPGEIWGVPDTLEFDVYFTKDNQTDKIRITIDITYGDLMACEFSVESPNIVNVIEYTSYGSKFDPSDTVFALTDDSLQALINFLNKFPDIQLKKEDLKFLDQYRDWLPK